MRAIDAFRDIVSRCMSAEELFDAFRREMADEGVENIVFVQLASNGVAELPFIHLPPGYVETYLAEGFQATDPVLAHVPLVRTAFYWADLEAGERLDRKARDTMDSCRQLGVHSGLTIPFHGPGGQVDFFSLSLRRPGKMDPSRKLLLSSCTYQVWQRYVELRETGRWRDHAGLEVVDGSLCAAVPRVVKPAMHSHAGGPEGMTAAHCEMLVLIEAAARRREAGLPRLSEELGGPSTAEDIAFLLSWGLVEEVPDDERWHYDLAPTLLGRMHLHRCPEVARLRREIWQLLVKRREVPAR